MVDKSHKGQKPSREDDGRYSPGHSGNPKGRPPKEEREITLTQHWRDLLRAMEEEATITVSGKAQKAPLILVCYQQLLRKGAAGDVRCIFKAIDLKEQILEQVTAKRNQAAEGSLRGKRAYRKDPGNMTNEELEAVRAADQLSKDPYWPLTRRRKTNSGSGES